MKILITGASGFVGSFLATHFIQKHHQIVGVGRRPVHPLSQTEGFEYISADTTVPGPWQAHVPQMDAIVNLAGKNIFHYWTDSSKQKMVDSRIQTTRNLVQAMESAPAPTLVSASAMGYYGDRGDAQLKEDAPAGSDFLAHLSVEWEQEALEARPKGARVALLRFSIVLGRSGGAFAKMLPAFRFFVGGPMGTGRQWLSWVHIQDLADAVEMILMDKNMNGPFNICAPHAVRNAQYAKALGSALGRPAFFRVPTVAVKTLMGELGGVMLASQRCLPDRLTQFGFKFKYADIESALAELVQ